MSHCRIIVIILVHMNDYIQFKATHILGLAPTGKRNLRTFEDTGKHFYWKNGKNSTGLPMTEMN